MHNVVRLPSLWQNYLLIWFSSLLPSPPSSWTIWCNTRQSNQKWRSCYCFSFFVRIMPYPLISQIHASTFGRVLHAAHNAPVIIALVGCCTVIDRSKIFWVIPIVVPSSTRSVLKLKLKPYLRGMLHIAIGSSEQLTLTIVNSMIQPRICCIIIYCILQSDRLTDWYWHIFVKGMAETTKWQHLQDIIPPLSDIHGMLKNV